MSGDDPSHVPDEVIAEIRKRERNGTIELPKQRLRNGDRVQVITGLLAGRRGRRRANTSRCCSTARGRASGAHRSRCGRADLMRCKRDWAPRRLTSNRFKQRPIWEQCLIDARRTVCDEDYARIFYE